MSYDRLATPIPMYNDGYDAELNENFASSSASASAPSPNPVAQQHRHRKRPSAPYGYGYSTYSAAAPRRRNPSLSPVRTNSTQSWLVSLPIPIPRIIRRIGSLVLRTPFHYLRSSFHTLRQTNPSVSMSSSSSSTGRRINLRRVKDPTPTLTKIVITLLAVASLTLIYLLLGIYEPHLELAFYSRKFVREEVLPIKPLAGCFNRPNWRYNVTERVYGPRMNEVQAGLEMRFGLDCYDFAGTVRSLSSSSSLTRQAAAAAMNQQQLPRTQFHTYWRSDLAPFGPRQEYMLKSFFATQNLATSKLVLWSNGDLRGNKILKQYLRRYGEDHPNLEDGSERGSFEVRRVDVVQLAKGTALDPQQQPHQPQEQPPVHHLPLFDKKAWVDGDLIRLLLLWNYGGVWVDMDFLLTRDLEPLLENEFVTQWDCYGKKYTPLNGALMRFYPHSPYLCEAFHIMATDSPPRPDSTDWGSTLYLKLYRRLVRGGVRPFKILPWCFTDGRSCRLDNRLPDPFKEDRPGGIGWWEDQSPTQSQSNIKNQQSWWNPWRRQGGRESQLEQGDMVEALDVSGGHTHLNAPIDDNGLNSAPGDVTYTGNPPALARALSQVFGIHLHNQWEKNFPNEGWVERILLRRYEWILAERKERERERNGRLQEGVGGRPEIYARQGEGEQDALNKDEAALPKKMIMKRGEPEENGVDIYEDF
ncbi:hypothetical protein D9757_014128 [Collybiopsis confluens]|uniref:Glycosyltransferase family 32 protein n=1 Tax=Collybiopsis confluens TaxID=2823264 RepID=A0A8H5GAY9_9AGAR|nr:hypothetical protein D9757_014128 [Collybiopsis confluens]